MRARVPEIMLRDAARLSVRLLLHGALTDGSTSCNPFQSGRFHDFGNPLRVPPLRSRRSGFKAGFFDGRIATGRHPDLG